MNNNNNNNTLLTTIVLILVIFTRLDEYNIIYRILFEDFQGKNKSAFQMKNWQERTVLFYYV